MEFNLAQVITEETEKKGAVIDIGARKITVPPPLVWKPEVFSQFFSDTAAAGEAVMGDKDWKAFLKAGGTPALFMELVLRAQQVDKDDAGESSAS